MAVTTFVESINVDFIINGKEHRLKCETKNMLGNTFEPGKDTLFFKIRSLSSQAFKDTEPSLATTAFEAVWSDGYDILFDIELGLKKEGHAVVIKKGSIKPVTLRRFDNNHMTIEKHREEQILKLFKNCRIIRVIAGNIIESPVTK